MLTLLLACLALQDASSPPAGDAEGFRYAPGRMPVGRLYRSAKSNVDGTSPSRVDLRVASETRLESFEFHAGWPEATLLVAEMDWRSFSVRRFEGDEERGGVPRRRRALDGPGLEDRGGHPWARHGPDPVVVDHEIDLPDEPGMRSGEMRPLETLELGPEAWAAHQAAALDGAAAEGD